MKKGIKIMTVQDVKNLNSIILRYGASTFFSKTNKGTNNARPVKKNIDI